MNRTYPIYVISKGRWESRLTVKALERMKVPYHVVIEPQEYERYSAVIDPANILPLPFSNLGQGSIPARNWVWEHALTTGAARHWILDDNIRNFYRLNRNTRIQVRGGAIFRAAEYFVDRYENVALAGFQYKWFSPNRSTHPAFALNRRIYSCILVKNDIPYRWRGVYNEDTDLSLRVLKDGWCTVLFYAFLADKMQTMTMKGGNTDKLYAGNGRIRMAQELKKQHPDIAQVIWKWGRWQHHVDYRPFKKNRLILKSGVVIPEGIDNFGMELKEEAA